MEEKVFISIIEKEDGLEVRVNEGAYGNLAIIGLLEKIKINLLADMPEEKSMIPDEPKSKSKPKYDA